MAFRRALPFGSATPCPPAFLLCVCSCPPVALAGFPSPALSLRVDEPPRSALGCGALLTVTSPLWSHTPPIASLLGNGNHLFRSPAQTSPRNSIHLTTSFMPPPDVANQPSTQRDPNRTRTFIQTPSPNESHSRNPFSISIHRTTAHLLIQTYGSSLPIFLPHAPCQYFTYFKVFP